MSVMIDLLKIVRMHARKVYRVHRQTQALRQRRVSRSSKATVLCADAPEHSPVETHKNSSPDNLSMSGSGL